MFVGAAIAAAAVAMLWVPFRTGHSGVVVAFALVVVSTAAGAGGRRRMPSPRKMGVTTLVTAASPLTTSRRVRSGADRRRWYRTMPAPAMVTSVNTVVAYNGMGLATLARVTTSSTTESPASGRIPSEYTSR